MKLNFNKIKEVFQKLPRIVAEKSFFACLILIFLAVLFGGIMFYKYSVLVKRAEPTINETSFQINEKNYQLILAEWQEKEKRFNEADAKQYPNPFKGIIPAE